MLSKFGYSTDLCISLPSDLEAILNKVPTQRIGLSSVALEFIGTKVFEYFAHSKNNTTISIESLSHFIDYLDLTIVEKELNKTQLQLLFV